MHLRSIMFPRNEASPNLSASATWKIIPVGLVAITAAFLLATVIAEFTLGFWGR